MAVILDYESLQGVLGMRDAIDLLEAASFHEAAGTTAASPRLNADFERGWMRILFAADYQTGYFATKAYHGIEGVGVRYVVTLYRLQDGEPVALIDGRSITDLRTGAASGVVARKVPIPGPISVGVIGSGNQARTQLESLAAVYDVGSAAVYSPTQAHREAFAREMSGKLGIAVTAVGSAEAAARGRAVVAAASSSKSGEPVLRGNWLDQCRLLCAVGNTRPQFAEADVACFRDAGLIVMDSLNAIHETGELRQAVSSGALPAAKRATLAQIVSGAVAVPRAGLIAFKSVGTALQDLALAARYYELLGSRTGFTCVSGLASLRPK